MDQLIIETIESMENYLPKLIKALEEMAEHFQNGAQNEAIHQLPTAFEGIEWIVSAINGLRNNGYFIDLEVLTLNKFLIEVEDALKNQDYILLADLLEYEIKPILEEWLLKCSSVSM